MSLAPDPVFSPLKGQMWPVRENLPVVTSPTVTYHFNFHDYPKPMLVTPTESPSTLTSKVTPTLLLSKSIPDGHAH